MLFDFYNTTIYQAVKMAKSFPEKLIKSANWLLSIMSLSFLMAFLGNKPFFGLSASAFLGLFLIVLSFNILGWIWLLFFVSALKSNIYLKPPLDQVISLVDLGEVNIAEYLDFDLAYAIRDALNFCRRKGALLDPLHVIFFLLNNERIERIFEKLDLNVTDIKAALKRMKESSGEHQALYGQPFIEAVKNAALQATSSFHRQIEIRDFLVAAAEYSKGFRDVLFDHDLNVADVNHVVSWDDFITYEAEWK